MRNVLTKPEVNKLQELGINIDEVANFIVTEFYTGKISAQIKELQPEDFNIIDPEISYKTLGIQDMIDLLPDNIYIPVKRFNELSKINHEKFNSRLVKLVPDEKIKGIDDGYVLEFTLTIRQGRVEYTIDPESFPFNLVEVGGRYGDQQLPLRMCIINDPNKYNQFLPTIQLLFNLFVYLRENSAYFQNNEFMEEEDELELEEAVAPEANGPEIG